MIRLPPPGDRVVWTGGASGSWINAANWLTSMTTSTASPRRPTTWSSTPGGATVTIQNDNRTARSVRVAAGNALVVLQGSLTLRADSEIDGTLSITNVNLNLGGDLTLRGTTNWNDSAFISLNGNTLTNLGSMTLAPIGSFGQRLLAHNGTVGNTGGTRQQGHHHMRGGAQLACSTASR
jgi:hypothetical protein